MLWHRPRHVYAASQYGYVKGRRREHAVLGIRAQLWRLGKQRVHAVAAFWDAANAFPSQSWQGLDNGSLGDFEQEDKQLAWQRYHRMLCTIQDSEDRILVMRPGCGDRQGDVAAAQRYVLGADRILDEWSSDTSTLYEIAEQSYQDPWTGGWMPPSHIQFADDTARVGCAENLPALVGRVTVWNASLASATAAIEMEQNPTKLQLLLVPAGQSARDQWQIEQLAAAAGLGKNLRKGAKHLGCVYEQREGNHGEVDACVRQAAASWCAHHGLWVNPGVPLQFKAKVFRATVQSALQAGLDIAILSAQDLRKLESSSCKKLRCMMLGAARGRTNEWTREQCGVYTMRSLLQQRRLCLCRSILKLIGNLQQAESALPALLFGRGMQPGTAQLTEEGSPAMSCNPWVRLWYADMEEAVRNGVLMDMPVNMMAWTDTPGYLSCKFKKVYSFRDSGEGAASADPIGPREGPGLPCPQCALQFPEAAAVARHLTMLHRKMSLISGGSGCSHARIVAHGASGCLHRAGVRSTTCRRMTGVADARRARGVWWPLHRDPET